MNKFTTDAAFGICVFIGLIMAAIDGTLIVTLVFIAALVVGLPLFYSMVVCRMATGEVGRWCLVLAFIFGVTAVLLVW